MRTQLLIASMIALAASGSAWSQSLPPSKATAIAQPLGYVAKDTPVVLDANKVGVVSTKKWKAGEICTMPAGSIVILLGPDATGKQRIQRTAVLKVKVPSRTACPFEATGTIDPLTAEAWKKAAESNDATKAAKDQGKIGKKS